MVAVGTDWTQRAWPAAVSTTFGVLVGVLTNLATAKWNWTLGVGLTAVAAGAVGFEFWRTRARARTAEANERDATSVAKESELRFATAIDHVLNPLFDLIGRIGDGGTTGALRVERRGEARALTLAGLCHLLNPSGRIRASYFELVDEPPALRLSGEAFAGSGPLPSKIGTDTTEGAVIMGIIERRNPTYHNGSSGGITAMIPDCDSFILAPVYARGEALGLLIVDTPVDGGLSDRDLSLAGLFAKLYGLVLTENVTVRQRVRAGKTEVRDA
nr:GAF domain-containing protein [Micromonospora sp. DSM 115978]